MSIVRCAIACAVLMLLEGCAKYAPISPTRTDKGHGEVYFPYSGMCSPADNGTVDWGDGTKTDLFRDNQHIYAYNGSYTVIIRCDGPWFLADTYKTRANVNDAQPSPSHFGLSGAALSGIAALITAIVAVLTFFVGLKRGKATPND
jgi:hypothetical protein